MQKIATITDLSKFPGAHHVSNQAPAAPDWYVVYGPAQGGYHPDIAILRALGGDKYLVNAEPDVIAKLGVTEDVQSVIDKGEWPLYATVTATKDEKGADTTITSIGAKPAVVDGKTVISTKPALDTALGKLTALDYTQK